ncbi:unnamed protein product [Somion occarium]|uniref:Ribosomal protein S14 n=1 Tax=Somion occarium TaxID=3059160 RepID=A0ABP1CSA7_9APHY
MESTCIPSMALHTRIAKDPRVWRSCLKLQLERYINYGGRVNESLMLQASLIMDIRRPVIRGEQALLRRLSSSCTYSISHLKCIILSRVQSRALWSVNQPRPKKSPWQF